MSQILQFLPQPQYAAAIAANSPSGTNPFATIADLTGGEDLAATLVIGNITGGTDIVITDGDEINYSNVGVRMYKDGGGTLHLEGLPKGIINTVTDAKTTFNSTGFNIEHTVGNANIKFIPSSGSQPSIQFGNGAGLTHQLQTPTITANRVATLQDASGTIAYLSDIPAPTPPVAITDDVIPRGTGTTTENGTWENVGNDIYPTTTGSNIGDATHRIGTLFMSSVIDHSTDLSFEASAVSTNLFKTSGEVQLARTGGNFYVGDITARHLKFSGGILANNSDILGSTWVGFQAYVNSTIPDINVALVANRFSHTSIRTTHDFYIEGNWNGNMGTSSVPMFKLDVSSGNIFIGSAGNPPARLSVIGADTSPTGRAMLVSGTTTVGGFQIQNDNRVSIGSASPSTTVKLTVQGISNAGGTFGIWHQSSVGGTLNWFRDDGAVHLAQTGGVTTMGNTVGGNYLRQNVQETQQFSSTATRTGFHANRNGDAQIAMRATSASDVSTVDSKGNLVISAGWNGNFASGASVMANSIYINSSTGFVGLNAPSQTAIIPSGLTVWNRNIEIVGSANGIVLESPDTQRWEMKINNAGSWTFVAIP